MLDIYLGKPLSYIKAIMMDKVPKHDEEHGEKGYPKKKGVSL